MSTTPVTNNQPAASSASTSGLQSQLNLTPTDFLNMMVTQLQNQDPLNPTSSTDLLSQMSQIGQLQSSTTLQNSLTSFGLQTSISAASSMIGKTVSGISTNNAQVTGTVTSVQVQSGNVSLGLSTGDTMTLSNVSAITPGTTTTTSGSGGGSSTPPAGAPPVG